MTIRLDYHLHTCHSMDCEQSLDTLCAAAVRTGLTEICITDHTEFGHPYPGSDVPPVVEDWLADIEAAREAWPQAHQAVARGAAAGFQTAFAPPD